MPPTLPININLANFPALRTRKALLMLDLQNDFVSPSGALPVSSPDGYVDRALSFAKAFRDSGSGDVIWIRSQFQSPRLRADARIITSSMLSIRGRQHMSSPSAGSDEDEDGDDASCEAFLTGTESGPMQSQRPPIVVPGSSGAELSPAVLSAVDTRRDLVLTKTHYSAFESTQLLMRLRTRLITELYICGALSNISIYATALDAASHGLAVTLIEDCCGYRDVRRHTNALTSIVQLTGCNIVQAQDLRESLPSPQPASSGQPADSFAAAIAAIAAASTGPPRRRPTSKASPGPVGFNTAGNSGAASIPVRTKSPTPKETEEGSKAMKKSAPGGSREDVVAPTIEEDGTKDKRETMEKGNEEDALSHLSSTAHLTISGAEKTRRPLQPVVDSASDPVHPTLKKALPARGEADTGDGSPAALATTKAHVAGRQQQLNSNQLSKNAATKLPDPRLDSEMQSPSDSGLNSSAKTAIGWGLDAETEPSPDVDTKKQRVATEPICEGDTVVYHNVLPESIANGMYERLRDEVTWLRMSHNGGEVPRLVCVQGDVSEDSIPIYRHPADESPPLQPFSPVVLQLRKEVENVVGHPLNHVLIQLYRTGSDYISEHSDKTLDIVQGSYVCNLSLGAERTMIFRTKRAPKTPEANAETGGAEAEKANGAKRDTVRVQLPHNSLCRMGLKTNMRWLHAIRQDKRSDRDRTAEELAFNGERISLTFRQIGTFLSHDQTMIWGQGAVAKMRKDARPVVNGQTDEAIRMLRAFGKENHSSTFDWAGHYGKGFDVLHISNAPRFFASADATVNLSIQLLLSHLGIAYAKGSMSGSPGTAARGDADTANGSSETSWLDLPVRLVDNDSNRSTVSGFLAILLYLDRVYGRARAVSPSNEALCFTRFQQALALLHKWKRMAHTFSIPDRPAAASPVKAMKSELVVWEGYILPEGGKKGPWLSLGSEGPETCLADLVFWPMLHSIEQVLSGTAAGNGDTSLSTELVRLGFLGLAEYYTAFGAREGVMRVVGSSEGKPELV